MSQYIVSARKYRPDSFESLIGQDNIARTLQNSIARGKIAHAYLFCGPRGVGKTSTARIFAKAINCEHPTAEMEPCGKCESCVSFSEGRSYCIHELDAASNNGVDDIKALLEQVQVPPQVGRYSVYIIDEVHMLSTAAFNAFLKTLEEPPAHAIFILATTEKHKIIPTILSRCQTYDFNRISIRDIVRNLRDIATKESVTIDDESLHIIAQKADGAMRDALTIFDQTVAFCGTEVKYADVVRNLNVLDYDYCFSLVDAFIRGDHASALLTFDEILAKGFNSLHFISSLSSHLRDLVVSSTAGLDGLLDLPESLKSRYAEQASRCSLDFLFKALGITTQCESGYRSSSNPRLHIEYAIMKLAFLLKAPTSESLTARPAPVQASNPATAINTARPAEEKPATAGPSPEAQPVAEKEPEAKSEVTAVPARNRSRRASGVSVSAMLSENRKKEEPEDVNAPKGEIPSDDAVREAWLTLAGQYSSKPRLANALAKSSLSFEETGDVKTMTFEVTNEAQKTWIEGAVLSELEAGLQSALSTRAVKLAIRAAEVVLNDEKYLPEEKARDLMAKNEEVKKLVIDLGLDIK